MMVRVRVFGALNRYLPGQAEDVLLVLAQDSTVDGLLANQNIPRDQVYVVTVNGEVVKNTHVLHADDEICLFSPIGGG